MQRHLTVRRPGAAVLLSLLASLAIAACGGSGPASSTGTNGSGGSTGTNGSSIHEAALKFAACVRAHGVPDFPDQSANRGLVRATPNKITVDGHTLAESPQVVSTAMNKCQKYSPAAKGPPISSAQLAKLKAGALAMARCMRANGVPNFPDPTVGTGPGGHGVSIGIRAGGPKPSGSRGGSSTTGSGSSGTGGAPFNPSSPTFKAAQRKCQPLMTKELPGGAPKG